MLRKPFRLLLRITLRTVLRNYSGGINRHLRLISQYIIALWLRRNAKRLSDEPAAVNAEAFVVGGVGLWVALADSVRGGPVPPHQPRPAICLTMRFQVLEASARWAVSSPQTTILSRPLLLSHRKPSIRVSDEISSEPEMQLRGSKKA